MDTNHGPPTLEKLQHRAFAAPVVGYLDGRPHRDLIDQFRDHGDSVILGPSDLAGDPRAFTEQGSVAEPDGCEPYDRAPTVTASAGDVP
jgi:hypothetical protein